MHVDAYITVVCEEVTRGCEFRALFYDRPTEQFYGGSGPTALEAIAWCLDEYCYRGLLGRGHRLARDPSEQPGDRLKQSSSSPPPPDGARDRDTLQRRPVSRGASSSREDAPRSPTFAKDEVGCFERKIPRRAESLLHGEMRPPRGRAVRR